MRPRGLNRSSGFTIFTTCEFGLMPKPGPYLSALRLIKLEIKAAYTLPPKPKTLKGPEALGLRV